MLATSSKEEVAEYENRTAKDEEADFYWSRPAGREQQECVDDAKTNGIGVAANHNDSFGEWKINFSKTMGSAVVWVAKEFAIDDELYYRADYYVEDNYYERGDPVDI